MRKGLTVLLISGLLLGGISFALSNLQGKPEQILTTDHESIITPPNDNAMRKGTHEIIRSDDNQFEVHGLLDTQSAIESQWDATQRTLAIVHRIINYALALVAIISMVVLIIAGIQMVTAAGNDKRYESWKQMIKKVVIGIIGLGVSWLIVSFIFWVLDLITK